MLWVSRLAVRLGLFGGAAEALRLPTSSAYTVDHAKSTNPAGHIATYRPGQRTAGPDLGAGSSGARCRAGFYLRSDEAD